MRKVEHVPCPHCGAEKGVSYKGATFLCTSKYTCDSCGARYRGRISGGYLIGLILLGGFCGLTASTYFDDGRVGSHEVPALLIYGVPAVFAALTLLANFSTPRGMTRDHKYPLPPLGPEDSDSDEV